MLDSFLAKIKKTDTCWLWDASLDGKGYGQVVYEGKLRRAHRVAYQLFKGDIPAGLDLDHLCRVRSCVNPEHLEAVTRSVNLQRGLLWQSKKTHCPQGHPYDYTDNRGARRCKSCYKANAHRNYLRRKAQSC